MPYIERDLDPGDYLDYTDFDTLRDCIEFDKNRRIRLDEGEKVILGENVFWKNNLITIATPILERYLHRMSDQGTDSAGA